MLRPKFYLAPDEGADGGASTVETPTATPENAETQESTPAPETPEANSTATPAVPGDTEANSEVSDDANAGSTDATEDPVVTTESLKQSLRAVAQERSRFKAELDATKAELESAKAIPAAKQPEPIPAATPDGYVDAGTLDASLKGLQYDPSDGKVLLDGDWVSPRIAKAALFAENEAQARETAQAQATEAKRVQAIQGIITATQTDIDTAIKGSFKGLPEEALPMLNYAVQNAVGVELQKQGINLADPYNLPDDFEAKVSATIIAEIKAARTVIAGLQAPQKQANAQAASEQPVPGGGKPAVPGIPEFDKLNPDEQHKATISMVDKFKAKFFG